MEFRDEHENYTWLYLGFTILSKDRSFAELQLKKVLSISAPILF